MLLRILHARGSNSDPGELSLGRDIGFPSSRFSFDFVNAVPTGKVGSGVSRNVLFTIT